MNSLRVNPSLEFGLDTQHNNNRRRSSVQEVFVSLGHEIQRVPDLVVTEAKKVINMNSNNYHKIQELKKNSKSEIMLSI